MKFKVKKYQKGLACVGVSALLLFSGVFFGVWKQGAERLYVLERPEWGEGEKEHTLLAENELGEQQEIKVTVREKEYTQQEVTEFLDKAEAYVREASLGENESWENIGADIVPIEAVPDLPVEIYWNMGEESYFDKQGQLLWEKVPQEGADANVTAVLLCQEERKDVELSLHILPPAWSEGEIWRQSVEEAVREQEEEQLGKSEVELPSLWEGKPVAYYQENLQKAKGGEWLLFSLSAGGLLYAAFKKEEKEEQERRRRQLLAEYPALVEKLLLFMGAGVSIRNIFFKLREEEVKKLLAKELERACQELKNGEPEGTVYIRFGERIGLLPYIRLGALLSQNQRSGTREVLEFLEREVEESYYERKEQAKKRGEEIGVKLLLPMGVLLFLTLGTIMVPAFLQF